MKKTIFELMKKMTEEKLAPRVEEYARLNNLTIGTGENGTVTGAQVAEQISDAEEFLWGQFKNEDFEGNRFEPPLMDMREALSSSDASIIFPRIISDVLQEPKEPNLFLQNQIADVIRLADNTPLLIEFPTVGAYQAYEMAEGQPYTNQTISFTQGMTSIRIKKIGCSASVNEEVLTHSMWPLLQLNLRLMSNAINRKVESILFQAMTNRAIPVFDNDADGAGLAVNSYEVANPTVYRTSGVALNQTWNGSFSYYDLVKMCGVLLGNRYEATHFLAHPLSWAIFAMDPIIRAQFYQGGQLGAGVWTREPAFDQTANFPFGIQYVPYYALPYNELYTLTGTSSSLGQAFTSDVYLLDKANSLYMATRGDTEMDQMENWFHDATQMKARKYVGVSAKDMGRGMVAAKNVRVVRNYESLFTTNTHSV